VGVLAERAGRARAGRHRQTGAGGSRGPARRLDLAGLALATGAVFAFTDGLLRGPAVGWGSAARGALRSPRPTGAGPAAHAEISLPASYPDISQEI